MASNPAPGELEQVRAFVNTWDAETDEETLATPDALARWLRERGLLDGEGRGGPDGERSREATGLERGGADGAATDEQLALAIDVREALRAVLLHHDGLELDPDAGPTLAEAARRVGLAVGFDEHATARIVGPGAGVDGALARLLGIVARAQQEGTWERLKVCPADDCQWAFYDRSRNRSAVWCDMRECGNRAKVRSYRERRRTPARGSA